MPVRSKKYFVVVLREMYWFPLPGLPGWKNAFPIRGDDEVGLRDGWREEMRIGQKESQFTQKVARRFVQEMIGQVLAQGRGVVVYGECEIEARKWLCLRPQKLRPGSKRDVVSQLLEAPCVFQNTSGATRADAGCGSKQKVHRQTRGRFHG